MPFVYLNAINSSNNSDKNCVVECKIIEIYQIICSYVEHEDSLIDHRSMWNILIQSFIFSSFATLLSKLVDINNDNHSYPKEIYFFIYSIVLTMCLAAILLNLATIWGVWAAGESIVRLEEKWSFVYKAYDFSHSHRSFEEGKQRILPVPFVTGGHKPIKKKNRDRNNKFSWYAEKNLSDGEQVSAFFVPSISGRWLPLSIPISLIIIWSAIAILALRTM